MYIVLQREVKTFPKFCSLPTGFWEWVEDMSDASCATAGFPLTLALDAVTSAKQTLSKFGQVHLISFP